MYPVRDFHAKTRVKCQDRVTESTNVWKWDGAPPWWSEKTRDTRGSCLAATGCKAAPQRTGK